MNSINDIIIKYKKAYDFVVKNRYSVDSVLSIDRINKCNEEVYIKNNVMKSMKEIFLFSILTTTIGLFLNYLSINSLILIPLLLIFCAYKIKNIEKITKSKMSLMILTMLFVYLSLSFFFGFYFISNIALMLTIMFFSVILWLESVFEVNN